MPNKRSKHFRWKLLGSGKRDSLDEQDLAHREEIRAFEEAQLDGYSGEQSRLPLKFLLPVFGAALLVVLVPVALSSLGGRGDAVTSGGDGNAGASQRLEETEIDVGAVSALTTLQVARAFLESTSLEERLPLVRHPESVQAEMDSFAGEVTAYPIAHQSIQRMGFASASGNLVFERFAVAMTNGGMRLLCVAKTPRGPLVDYQAFARYGTASWDDLLAGKEGEEVRLVVKPSFYFHHSFSDDSDWTAFELSNPDWPGNLTGYAPKGSDTAKVLAEIISAGPKQRVILKLRPEGESHRHKQVVIERVLASGWVRTEGDIESKWQLRQRQRETTSLR